MRAPKTAAVTIATDSRAPDPRSRMNGHDLGDLLVGIVHREIAIAVGEIGRSRWMRGIDSPLGMRAVRRLVAEGVLPSARPIKHLLIDREAHDRWIAAHASTTAPSNDNDGDKNDDADLDAAFGIRRNR
jgi:hypothetical protein